MAEYIGCRNCESPDCKGCNLKNLETMLNNGKFDCLMNGNRCINPAADVAPVRHGLWETIDASTWRWTHDGAKPVHRVKYRHNECGRVVQRKEPYCPTCGAKMDLEG